MMRAGTETGSLINHLMSMSGKPPEVGMGATILRWTDRSAGTIIKVTAKTVTVQKDNAKRIDKNGMSEDQKYEYTPDPDGTTYIFRLTKSGWKCKGMGLMIGSRQQYHDYSF